MNLRGKLVGAVPLALLIAVDAGAHRHIPREAVTTFTNEWNRGNVEGAVALFQEEGTLFVPQASYARGRVQIGELLATIFRRDAGKLEMGKELNYREFWHWATLDIEASLSRAGQTQPVILHAIVVQTKDGPGQVDCQAGRACDEWSLAALWMVGSSTPAAQGR